MDNETERPVEKLLRDCARKRREDAGTPLELHPATRRLLQGEVARRYAQAEREQRSFLQLFAVIWRRSAWTLVIVVGLSVVGAVWLWPGGQSARRSDYAANERSLSTRSANQPGSVAFQRGERETAPAAQPATPIAAAAPPLGEPAGVAEDRAARPQVAAADNIRPEPANEPLSLGKDRMPADQLPAPASPLITTTAAAKDEKLKETKESAATFELAQKPLDAPVALMSTNSMAQAQATASVSNETALFAIPATQYAYKSVPAGGVAGARSQTDTFASAPQSAAADGLLAGVPKAKNEAYDSLTLSDADVSRGTVSAVITQRYARLESDATTRNQRGNKTAPGQSLLASFDVAQSGSELRITDGDGSVYIGSVQPTESVQRLRAFGGQASAPAKAAPTPAASLAAKSLPAEATAQAGQVYSFRVAGTNQTLKQIVVFSGSFIPATNLALSGVMTNAWAASINGHAASEAGQALALPLGTARITGRAVIGSARRTQEIEINAGPVAR